MRAFSQPSLTRVCVSHKFEHLLLLRLWHDLQTVSILSTCQIPQEATLYNVLSIMSYHHQFDSEPGPGQSGVLFPDDAGQRDAWHHGSLHHDSGGAGPSLLPAVRQNGHAHSKRNGNSLSWATLPPLIRHVSDKLRGMFSCGTKRHKFTLSWSFPFLHNEEKTKGTGGAGRSATRDKIQAKC